MPPAKRAYPGEVRTRLTTDDLKRFKLLAEAKKLGGGAGEANDRGVPGPRGPGDKEQD